MGLIAHVAAFSGNGNAVTSSGIDTRRGRLIVAMAAYQDGSSYSFSDSLGNIWNTSIPTEVVSGVSVGQMFFCINPITGPSQTFTSNGSSTFPAHAVAVFDDQVVFFNSSGSTASSVTSLNTGAVGSQKQLVVSGFGIQANTSGFGVDNGLSITDTVLDGTGHSYAVGLGWLQSASGIMDIAWVWSPASYGGVILATFNIVPVHRNFKSQTVKRSNFF